MQAISPDLVSQPWTNRGRGAGQTLLDGLFAPHEVVAAEIYAQPHGHVRHAVFVCFVRHGICPSRPLIRSIVRGVHPSKMIIPEEPHQPFE